MAYGYRLLYPERLPSQSVGTLGPACTAGIANAAAHIPSLRQCGYLESGGSQCELEYRHEGGHVFTDDLFRFLQVRYGKLQGPLCRTRRGPPEYVYEEGPMCL